MTDSVHIPGGPEPGYFPRLIRDCWHVLPLAAKIMLLAAFYATMAVVAVNTAVGFVGVLIHEAIEKRRRQ